MHMIDPRYHRMTLALAGTLQAANLMQSLANTGVTQPELLRMHLTSLLIIEPKNVLDVYQDESHLKLGLNLLKEVLSPKDHRTRRGCLHYLMAVIHLQDKLRHDAKRCHVIQQSLQRVQDRLQYFDILDDTIIENFADIYLDNIATFRYRIQVVGQPTYLKQGQVLCKIRATLLAAIRSAMLWRQVGGTRIHFLLRRNKIANTARQLLASMEQHDTITHH